MFTPERWAEAFINAIIEGDFDSGGNSGPGRLDGEAASGAIGEGLDLLRVLSPLIRAIPGSVSGTSAAAQLEKMLRKTLPEAGRTLPATGPGAVLPIVEEIAIRFILLLIKKNLFRHINAVIAEIEAELDHLRGILPVTLESAAAPAGDFEGSLKKQLIEKTGARGIKLDTRLIPELLGGYRLRIGGDIIDASLRSRLQRMGADLAAAHDAGHAGALSALPIGKRPAGTHGGL
jgi:F-type H+-transporting ATPase subunit delta